MTPGCEDSNSDRESINIKAIILKKFDMKKEKKNPLQKNFTPYY